MAIEPLYKLLTQPLEIINQPIRRRIMRADSVVIAQFRQNGLCQLLAQLHPHLVKRINPPNHALREDAVFVKRDEFAENFRREPIG